MQRIRSVATCSSQMMPLAAPHAVGQCTTGAMLVAVGCALLTARQASQVDAGLTWVLCIILPAVIVSQPKGLASCGGVLPAFMGIYTLPVSGPM
jgi:hypothetical protein